MQLNGRRWCAWNVTAILIHILSIPAADRLLRSSSEYNLPQNRMTPYIGIQFFKRLHSPCHVFSTQIFLARPPCPSASDRYALQTWNDWIRWSGDSLCCVSLFLFHFLRTANVRVKRRQVAATTTGTFLLWIRFFFFFHMIFETRSRRENEWMQKMV